MLKTLDTQGRGAIFNEWLASYGRNQKGLIEESVRIYRHHMPHLRLYLTRGDCCQA